MITDACLHYMNVVDERTAAELPTAVKQHRNPRPFIWVSVLTANDSILILKKIL